MRTHYRLVEKRWGEQELWEPWGAVYENCSGRFAGSAVLVLSTLAEHRSTVRHFEERIEQWGLTLEDAQRMFGDYAARFRLRPEIEVVEGESYRKIRRRLRKRIFAAPEPEAAQPAVEPMPAWEEHTPQPAYQVLRESGESGEAEEKEPS